MRKLAIFFIFNFMATSLIFAEQTVHYLKNGETIYALSRQYKVSVNQLKEVNAISDTSSLKEGSKIIIPTADNNSNEEPIMGDSYTIKPGDTYFSLARRRNVDISELFEQTGKASSQSLKVGEVIKFNTPAPSPAPTTNDTPAPTTTVVDTATPAPIATATEASNKEIITNETVKPNSLQEEKAKEVAQTEDYSSIINENLSNNKLNNNGSSAELAVMDGVTWPVFGEISEHNGRQRGVQITIDSEQNIKALSTGTVVYKGSYRELGQIVVVEHSEGYTYLYSGFDNAFVNIGDNVVSGTNLGKASSSNKIIFSVFKDGNPINPKTAPRT